MSKSANFGELFEQYVRRAVYTPGQLAKLTGVPKMTIVNWRNGVVARPRLWTDVVKLGRALRLSLVEMDLLLAAAGYPSLAQLQQLGEKEQALFTFWQTDLLRPLAPFQAVAKPRACFGREMLLRRLEKKLLAEQHEQPCVLLGMVGMGKTVLAVQLAHQVRPYFPDGVLWGRPDATPIMDILRLFAEAYGKDVGCYGEFYGRSQALCDLLASKQALVVLDNVVNVEEIRPFLTCHTPSTFLITTRHPQVAQALANDVTTVPPLASDGNSSLALFADLTSTEYVAQHRETLLTLAACVGHWPLLLTLLGGRLSYDAALSPDQLLRYLSQQGQTHVCASETSRMQAVLQMSFDLLGEAQQRLFVALATFGGRPFLISEATAVSAHPLDQTELMLEDLYDLGFVRIWGNGRYCLTPTLHEFAILMAERICDLEERPFVKQNKRKEMRDWNLEIQNLQSTSSLSQIRRELYAGANKTNEAACRLERRRLERHH